MRSADSTPVTSAPVADAQGQHLSRDYERRPDTDEAVSRWSMITLMSRFLAAPYQPLALPAE
jgi:hypothetical protein